GSAGPPGHGPEPGGADRRRRGAGLCAPGPGVVPLGSTAGPADPDPGLRRAGRPRLERPQLVDLGPDRLLPGLPVAAQGGGSPGAVERAGPGSRRLSAGQPAVLDPARLSGLP